MLVTRKLNKTKFQKIIKSKTKVKDTSENANRKKAGAILYIRSKKLNSRSKAHRIRTSV